MKKKKRSTLIGEAEEKLDAMGQESEKKAVKWVKEAAQEKEQAQKKKEELDLTLLDGTRKKHSIYRQYLIHLLHDMVMTTETAKHYTWGTWFDGKGIIIHVRDKYSKSHVRAFSPSYSPEHDLFKVAQFARWAEDIYDAVEGNLAVDDKSKIWTPTKPSLPKSTPPKN